MSQRHLPEDLHAAYEWTDAAGEVNELRSLEGPALTRYCRESARNWRDNDGTGAEVTADDLSRLADWLRPRVIVTICSDPASLGTSAGTYDVDHYASNLASYLGEQFPACDFTVRLHAGDTVVTGARNQHDAITAHIAQLESGDGWRALLPEDDIEPDTDRTRAADHALEQAKDDRVRGGS